MDQPHTNKANTGKKELEVVHLDGYNGASFGHTLAFTSGVSFLTCKQSSLIRSWCYWNYSRSN